MDDREDGQLAASHLIYETIVGMRQKFAGAKDQADFAGMVKLAKLNGGLFEAVVDGQRG